VSVHSTPAGATFTLRLPHEGMENRVGITPVSLGSAVPQSPSGSSASPLSQGGHEAFSMGETPKKPPLEGSASAGVAARKPRKALRGGAADGGAPA
jgi:hypothetical protein